MLKKKQRLRKRKDFSKVYKKGKSTHCSFFAIYYSKNTTDTLVGFSLSRKVGNAVIRNKYRRKLQDIVRVNFDILDKGNYILVAKPNITKSNYQILEKSFFSLINNLKNKA